MNEIFKLPPLYQLFIPDIQDEETVGLLQHGIDFVDPDVAVFRSLADRERHFTINRNPFPRYHRNNPQLPARLPEQKSNL